MNYKSKVELSTNARALLFAAVLSLLPVKRLLAEDRADFKFNYYLEDNHRVEVYTPSLFVEKDLGAHTTLRLHGVYDVISGATPTGEPMKQNTRVVSSGSPMSPPAGIAAVSGPTSRPSVQSTGTTIVPYGPKYLPTANFHDKRVAVDAELEHHAGEWILAGGTSFSKESDYVSISESARIGRYFNDRSTTVSLGVSFNQDSVLNVWKKQYVGKDAVEGLVTISQILDKNTLLTLNYAPGYSKGYLDDQYKVAQVNGTVVPEKRPHTRDKHAVYLLLNRHIKPLNGSLEASYRFYTDSYNITAHTLGLTWYQKIGEHFILAPGVRYYQQTAADFYHVSFTGNPTYYSADYRLSKFASTTFGLQAIWKFSDKFSMDIAYDRYSQWGRDGRTSNEAYPKANIVTMGFKLWY